jgi:hypothetical protein
MTGGSAVINNHNTLGVVAATLDDGKFLQGTDTKFNGAYLSDTSRNDLSIVGEVASTSSAQQQNVKTIAGNGNYYLDEDNAYTGLFTSGSQSDTQLNNVYANVCWGSTVGADLDNYANMRQTAGTEILSQGNLIANTPAGTLLTPTTGQIGYLTDTEDNTANMFLDWGTATATQRNFNDVNTLTSITSQHNALGVLDYDGIHGMDTAATDMNVAQYNAEQGTNWNWKALTQGNTFNNDVQAYPGTDPWWT